MYLKVLLYYLRSNSLLGEGIPIPDSLGKKLPL